MKLTAKIRPNPALAKHFRFLKKTKNIKFGSGGCPGSSTPAGPCNCCCCGDPDCICDCFVCYGGGSRTYTFTMDTGTSDTDCDDCALLRGTFVLEYTSDCTWVYYFPENNCNFDRWELHAEYVADNISYHTIILYDIYDNQLGGYGFTNTYIDNPPSSRRWRCFGGGGFTNVMDETEVTPTVCVDNWEFVSMAGIYKSEFCCCGGEYGGCCTQGFQADLKVVLSDISGCSCLDGNEGTISYSSDLNAWVGIIPTLCDNSLYVTFYCGAGGTNNSLKLDLSGCTELYAVPNLGSPRSCGVGSGDSIAMHYEFDVNSSLLALTQLSFATSTANASTMTITSIVGNQEECILVSVATNTDPVAVGSPTSCTWNGIAMTKITLGSAPTADVFYLNVTSPATASVVVTFPSTISSARSVIVESINSHVNTNITAVAGGTGPTPDSGDTATSGTYTYAHAVVATAGPQGDAAGTWDTGYTAGNRKGITGSQEVTLSTGHKFGTSAGTFRSKKTSITSRDWSAGVAAFGIEMCCESFNVSIDPADMKCISCDNAMPNILYFTFENSGCCIDGVTLTLTWDAGLGYYTCSDTICGYPITLYTECLIDTFHFSAPRYFIVHVHIDSPYGGGNCNTAALFILNQWGVDNYISHCCPVKAQISPGFAFSSGDCAFCDADFATWFYLTE